MAAIAGGSGFNEDSNHTYIRGDLKNADDVHEVSRYGSVDMKSLRHLGTIDLISFTQFRADHPMS